MHRLVFMLILSAVLVFHISGNEVCANTASRVKAARVKSGATSTAKQPTKRQMVQLTPESLGRVEGPRDMSMFDIEPTV